MDSWHVNTPTIPNIGRISSNLGNVAMANKGRDVMYLHVQELESRQGMLPEWRDSPLT